MNDDKYESWTAMNTVDKPMYTWFYTFKRYLNELERRPELVERPLNGHKRNVNEHEKWPLWL